MTPGLRHFNPRPFAVRLNFSSLGPRRPDCSNSGRAPCGQGGPRSLPGLGTCSHRRSNHSRCCHQPNSERTDRIGNARAPSFAVMRQRSASGATHPRADAEPIHNRASLNPILGLLELVTPAWLNLCGMTTSNLLGKEIRHIRGNRVEGGTRVMHHCALFGRSAPAGSGLSRWAIPSS